MLRSGIDEAGEFLPPNEFHVTDRTIALLRDNNLSLSGKLFAFVTGPVIFLAVDEHHDIGVLFNGARFAEMAQPRAVLLGDFRLPIQLRQAEHWYVEFSCQPF